MSKLVRRTIILDFDAVVEPRYTITPVVEDIVAEVVSESSGSVWEWNKIYRTANNRTFVSPYRELDFTVNSRTLVFTGRFIFGGRQYMENFGASTGIYRSKLNISTSTILVVAPTSGIGKLINAINYDVPIYSEYEFYKALVAYYDAYDPNNTTYKPRLERIMDSALSSNDLLNNYILTR